MSKTTLIVLVGFVAGGFYAARSFYDVAIVEEPQGDMRAQMVEEVIQNENLQMNQISIADNILTVEIAETPEERMQGLSGRENLPNDSGMLFIFNPATVPSFWMKDMKFAIDIVWIDEGGKVIGAELSVEPKTYPQTYSPEKPVMYALEVKADWFKANNIKVGDVVTGSVIK